MKNQIQIVSTLLLLFCFTNNLLGGNITDSQVKKLVKYTASEIEKDAKMSLDKITNAEYPFRDSVNTALYVFVFNLDLVTVAHPNNKLMTGKSKKGKPDINGKLFRDEILSTALTKGSGWVSYQFENPRTKKIEDKKTYFELITGSDGNKYIVCCGKYIIRK